MKPTILLCLLTSAAPVTVGWAAVAQPELEILRQELRELRQRTEELERKLQQYESPSSQPTHPGSSPSAAAPATAAMSSFPDAVPEDLSQERWSPTQPQSLFRAGPAYLNLSLSTLIDAGWSTTSDVEELQLGGHDPVQRGFSLPSAELALDGAVDPYFKGFANVVFLLDKENETEVELEEAFLISSSLPANLQLKAGQFNAEFGRHNQQHAHAWAFVDQPLILNRVFGPDGLRNPGARLSWLMPTPFYSELFLAAMNGNGETAFSFRNAGEADPFGVNRVHGRATIDRDLRGPGDLLFVPRWATSFDLTHNQTLLLGTSAAFGPNNTGPQRNTQVYGLDAYWKWTSPTAAKGFPFVAVQSEALFRRFEAGADTTWDPPLPEETLQDWGFYTQALWGFRPRWVAGLRGEFVSGDSGTFDDDDALRADRTRLSPNLTWFPSEFSKIRLQYNFDQGQEFGDEHSVWLQLEFLLGAHAAHKF